VETHKVTSPSKGVLNRQGTVTSHKRESTHLHPNMEAALHHVGQPIPPPESGIGKDPRKAYEDEHWTEDQKKGYQAYAQSVRDDPVKREGGGRKVGRVGNMAQFWNEKERMASPPSGKSVKLERPKSEVSDKIKSLHETVQNLHPENEERKLESDQSAKDNLNRLSMGERIELLENKQRECTGLGIGNLESGKSNGKSPIGEQDFKPSPKLTHPTKNRARPPNKSSRLSTKKNT
jgi:hypothetical protein